MNVEVRPIEGYEGLYAVAADGRVLAYPRLAPGSHGSERWIHGRWLRSGADRARYRIVALCKDGKQTTKKVHRLVGYAWLPQDDPYRGLDINHKNGVVWDNRVENLEWCTRSMNARHAVATGLRPVTDKQRQTARKMGLSMRKVTDEMHLRMKDLRGVGWEYQEIAAALGVATSTAFIWANR